MKQNLNILWCRIKKYRLFFYKPEYTLILSLTDFICILDFTNKKSKKYI